MTRRADVLCGVVLALATLLVVRGPFAAADKLAQPLPKVADSVQVTADQMHQLSIVKVRPYAFRVLKTAVGQIAFNEDASTVVLTPFAGRVTKLIARIGDEVKRGDPLFEIDSPEVVQAQTDLIAAVQGLEKAKSQLILAKSVLDRQVSLLAGRATAQREVDQARNEHASAESDLATAQGTLTAARNRMRVIVGRNQSEVERVERERLINPLITVDAPIDGTVTARKVGPGQYVAQRTPGRRSTRSSICPPCGSKPAFRKPTSGSCASGRRSRCASPPSRTACSGRASRRSARHPTRTRGGSSCARRFPIRTACCTPRCSRPSGS